MASGPLLHVGYHKTGTTWLQRRVFAAAPYARVFHRRTVIDDFVVRSPFDELEAATRASYAETCDALLASGRHPVVSQERLCGSPHTGGPDALVIADRLKDMFPDARVLIVIREQRSMLQSTYAQYVSVGGPMPIERYLLPSRRGRVRIPQFRLDYFEYDHLIEHYRHRFSPDAVLVLPFEYLQSDSIAFMAAIARHVGVAEPSAVPSRGINVSTSALSMSLKRWGNQLLVRDAFNPSGWFNGDRVNGGVQRIADRVARSMPGAMHEAAQQRLRTRIETIVGERYRESNTRTARLTGLDLAEWGYALT